MIRCDHEVKEKSLVSLAEFPFAFCSLCIGCQADRPADTPPGLFTLGDRQPPNASSQAPRPPRLCYCGCCCCCRLAGDKILPRWSQRCSIAPDIVIVQRLEDSSGSPPPIPLPPPPTTPTTIDPHLQLPPPPKNNISLDDRRRDKVRAL